MESSVATIPQIVEEIRNLAGTSKDGILAVQGETLAARIESAYKNHVEIWQHKVDDVIEIADGFKRILTKVLDQL